jgi:hypothetical protein
VRALDNRVNAKPARYFALVCFALITGTVVIANDLAYSPPANAADPDLCQRARNLVDWGEGNFDNIASGRIKDNRFATAFELEEDSSQCALYQNSRSGQRILKCIMHDFGTNEIGFTRNAMRKMEGTLTDCLTKGEAAPRIPGTSQLRYSKTVMDNDDIRFDDVLHRQNIELRLTTLEGGRVGIDFSMEGSVKVQFVLANFSLRCVPPPPSDKHKNSPQASSLITMISATEESYINALKEFLQNKAQTLTPIANSTDDANYLLLDRYAKSRKLGSEGVLKDLGDESRWVAYAVQVRDPSHKTIIPIPTRFEQGHTTRILLVTSQQQKYSVAHAEAQSLDNASRPKEIVPLLEVELKLHEPGGASPADIDVRSFASETCWSITIGR